ncbi:MAG: hypothetical protein ABIH36_01460 [bacterium]
MQNGISAHTEIIVKEACRRGIKATTMEDINRNIAVLELNGHRELVCQSCSNKSGSVTYKIFSNKALAINMLEQLGFPVPATLYTDDLNMILRFLEKHRKIVIKPVCGVQGNGVTPNITTPGQVARAVKFAREQKSSAGERRVVCQEHVDGQEMRLLVLDKRIVYAVQRFAAGVASDGVSNVEQLIKSKNDSAPAGRRVKLGEMVSEILSKQGLDLESVPEKGRQVVLAAAVNAHLGGTVVDITNTIGETIKSEAMRVAELFDASVVGIDCITPDIKSSIGRIIELNSAPDLTLHLQPTRGDKRNPARDIVDMLFPETVADGFNLNGKTADKS